MLYLDLVLASILSVQPADEAPAPAPAPAPTPAPASTEPAPAEPAPAEPEPEPEPEPALTPTPESAEPTRAETVRVMPVPPPEQPEPSAPPPDQPKPSPSAGIGMLVTGPLLVLVGAPLSLVGNTLWRDGCSPDSSVNSCANGTAGSMGMHFLASASYGLGISFTGLGARKRADYSVYSGRGLDPAPAIATGAVLLPLGLLGIGVARALFWLPTPGCLEYSCVQRYQTYSTISVAASAAVAAGGAGLLMHGLGVRHAKRRRNLSFAPRLGRDMAGLSLTGTF